MYVKPHLAWPNLCLYIDNRDMYEVLLEHFVFRFNSMHTDGVLGYVFD